MTDQGPHTPTAQETALYEAMSAGDWATVVRLEADARAADQARPEDAADDWVSPAEQYEIDYGYAYAHYQADHEAPEEEREQATAETVAEENSEAARG